MVDFIHTDKGTYYISTNAIILKFETMIFKCKKDEPKTDDDVDWSGVYVEQHNNKNDAVKRHYEIIHNIEQYI
jgi:hypothetical protein